MLCYHPLVLYLSSQGPYAICSFFSPISPSSLQKDKGGSAKPLFGSPFTIPPHYLSPGGIPSMRTSALAMEGERESLFSAHLAFRLTHRNSAIAAQGGSGWKSARP